MQNDYAHPAGAYGKAGIDLHPVQSILPALRRIIETAHRVGVLVIYTRNWKTPRNISRVSLARAAASKTGVGPNGMAGTWGADWYGVTPGEEDVVISKARYDAFLETELEQILRARKIQCLVFAGTQTNVCVESTARSAFMRDYFIVLLEDATAAISEEIHHAALDNLANYFGDVVTVDEICEIWLETASASEYLITTRR
jgi:ureidoacrylate peracid hydrolase